MIKDPSEGFWNTIASKTHLFFDSISTRSLSFLPFSLFATPLHHSTTMRFHLVALAAFCVTSSAAFSHKQPVSTKNVPTLPSSSPNAATAAATAALAVLLMSTEPALATTSQAAQIHLNNLPPTTISVQIGDLPVIGKLFSGTYTKIDSPLSNPAAIVINSPTDKIGAIKNAATGGHLEFDIDGLLATHLEIDVAASKAGAATIRLISPVLPQLPYRNSASAAAILLPVDTTTVANAPTKTAAHISLTKLPPTAIDVEIGDLPVIGKLLSGVYTKVDGLAGDKPASITINSPTDKLGAIRAATTGGHLEFDVDGLITTHLDVDIAAEKAGVATIRVSSPLIPQLPYQNKAKMDLAPLAKLPTF